MERLVQEICSQGHFKQLLFKTLFSTVKTQVLQKIGVDMGMLEIGHLAAGVKDVSVLLMHSRADQFVHFSHSERILDSLGCYKKSLVELSGGHNDDRSPEAMDQVVSWLNQELQAVSNQHQSFSYFTTQLPHFAFSAQNQKSRVEEQARPLSLGVDLFSLMKEYNRKVHGH